MLQHTWDSGLVRSRFSKKERVAHGFEMDSVVMANNRPNFSVTIVLVMLGIKELRFSCKIHATLEVSDCNALITYVAPYLYFIARQGVL
jgi:hypothetical protein